MELCYMANQIHSLAIGGYLNGAKYTPERWFNQMKTMLRKPGDRYIFEISLPDGRWLARATWVFGNQFDYWIPDTRGEELRLYDELGLTR